jgi:hypothetical protein
MSYQVKAAQPALASSGFMSRAWRYKLWWLLPLAVLLLLLGAIYALDHLSSADSEMYPTSLRLYSARLHSC